MCGRYALTTPPEVLAELLKLHLLQYDYAVRYNVAPTQTVPVVREVEPGKRELVGMHWGLIPSWAKERAIGNRLINARSESVEEKPSFRHAFKKRRCVIPASGFYEWKKLDARRKQPYLITRRNDTPLLFAGLWECWHDPETDRDLESCTILTTEANAELAELHDRMPVVLDAKSCAKWLADDDDAAHVTALKKLLKPAPGSWFVKRAVSSRINSPKHDDPSVLEPPPPPPDDAPAEAGGARTKAPPKAVGVRANAARKGADRGQPGLFDEAAD